MDRGLVDTIPLPFPLPTGWHKARLADCCEFIRDGDWIETKDQGGSDFRLVQVSNVGVGRFIETPRPRWITQETFDRLRCTELAAGDVLVARMPDPTGRAWRINALSERAITAVDVAIIRTKQDILDPRFLAYYLNSPAALAVVRSLTTGSTRLRIRRADIERSEVPVPPMAVQLAIADTLGSLDDKVDLNRRMSETLESMARALFKSWFVDFDPVRAKSEGRDPGLPQPIAGLFPTELADSGIGDVPTAWTGGRFGDVVEQVREVDDPRLQPDIVFDHYSLPAFDDGQRPAKEPGIDIKSQKWKVTPGSVLVSKLNPATDRTWLPDPTDTDRAIASTEFLVLEPRLPFGRSYVYCLARSDSFRTSIAGLATGTSGSHQRANPASVLLLPVVLPPASIVRAFEDIAAPMLERALVARRESATLTAMRDTLLPHLFGTGVSRREGRSVHAH